MIKIERSDLADIAEEYFEYLDKWRKRRRTRFLTIKAIPDNIFRELILCPPEKLENHKVPNYDYRDFTEAYSDFFADEIDCNGKPTPIGHWLAKRLNIRVCPYCNRIYTSTVQRESDDKNSRIRPEFDHFYPKSKYSHLALSFYNLIPSCPICNHVKRDAQFDFHPYIGSKDAPFFEIESPTNPKIVIRNHNLNTQSLALEELYNEHSDYVEDLLDKIQAYDKSLYEPLSKDFQMSGKTPEEIDRLIWGTPLDETQLEKYPLAKLTYDILHWSDIV